MVLQPDKTSFLLHCRMQCFSCMLISNVHKTIIVMNSLDTRFSRNVFEAIQKIAAHVLSRLKPSSFKHYVASLSSISINVLAFYQECCSIIGYTTSYSVLV